MPWRIARLGASLAICGAAPLTGQAPTAAPIPADSDLVRFLTAEVTRQMRMLDVPGGVVVLVRDGRVLAISPLGQASVSPAVPVDERTTFRIASVAKVFTALAVLELAERGRVRLDSDIRPTVPDVRVRGLAGRPLTLHQLLTHTAGFDDQLVGYLNPAGATAESLGAYLRRALPERTRIADDIPAYSNHGYALAGYVVERVTGIAFSVYVRDSVLVPLGMMTTRFVLEARDTVGLHLASEYRSTGERRPFRSSRAYPAGNIATTGADMARFLVALGEAVAGDTASPIPPSVGRRLVSPVLTYHPALPGMAYGLSGVRIHGRTVFMKGGASPSHSAMLAMVPEAGVSVFIAVNRQEPLVWERAVSAFVGRFFSIADPARAAAAPTRARAGLAGHYLWTRAPLGSIETIIGLGTQIAVSAIDSGVRIDGLGDIAGTYVARDSLRFVRADGREVAFRTGPGGRATHAFSVIQGQPFSFERIGLTRTAAVQLGAVLAAVLLAVVAGATAARRASGAILPVSVRAAIVALPVVEIACIATVLALVPTIDALQEGPTRRLHLALALCTLAAGGALVQMIAALAAARAAGARSVLRGIYVAGAAGGLLMFWFLITNHLVGHW